MGLTVIVGSNRGIGLALAKALTGRGETVVGVCRTASEGLKNAGLSEIVEGVDVSADAGVATLVAAIGDRTITTLIHNAGIMTAESLKAMDFGNVLRQLDVNAIAPLRVVTALRGALGAGSKVGLVTSRMGSMTDNTSGGMYGYRMSKAALNMAGVSLAHDLRKAGVAVILLHPGFVKTDMTNNRGLIEAPESARGLIAQIDALTLETSGSFMHQSGEALPW